MLNKYASGKNVRMILNCLNFVLACRMEVMNCDRMENGNENNSRLLYHLTSWDASPKKNRMKRSPTEILISEFTPVAIMQLPHMITSSLFFA
jgi:hypothetical protein